MYSIIMFAISVFISVFINIKIVNNNTLEENNINTQKSATLAANIFLIQDIVSKYILKNYNYRTMLDGSIAHGFHDELATKSSDIENINILNFDDINYELKQTKTVNYLAFLNYQLVTFNYLKSSTTDANIAEPILYLIISFDKLQSSIHNYTKTNMLEATAIFGEELSVQAYNHKHTNYISPLFFKQNDCVIQEMLTANISNYAVENQKNNIKQFFDVVCGSLQHNYDYKLLKYVYILPIYNPIDF